MDRELKRQISEAIVEGIRRNADRCFSTSQSTSECFVPVNTGNLKRSGIVEHIPGGARIAYRANYSADVEWGREEQLITGTQTVHIHAHKRKTRKGSSIVKAHDKKYVNKRLIGFRPKYAKFEYGDKIFRVINKISATRAQLFLSRAVAQEIVHLPTDIAFYLKKFGSTTVTR